MSEEQLKSVAYSDTVVTIPGYVITTGEVKQAQAELLDDELESISGGAFNTCVLQVRLTNPYDLFGCSWGCG